MTKTLTYSEAVQGWVSFYSFNPDWIIGMNNYLYTFKGGNLYRHNTNEERNTFYKDWWTRIGDTSGSFTPSRLETVINTSVLENKLFKTMDIQGDSPWDMTMETDLQYSGYIQSEWFERKEAVYFAFIRNNSTGQLSLRSLNGIGSSSSVDGGGTEINFSIQPLVAIGNIISVGDLLYFGPTAPLLAGKVTNIEVDYPAGINRLIIDTSIPNTVPIPTGTEYFLSLKSSVAESHGVLGHYCKINMTNNYNVKIELFAVESDVMKSYP